MAAENKVESLGSSKAEIVSAFELQVLYLHIFYGTTFNQSGFAFYKLYEHAVPEVLLARENKKLWPDVYPFSIDDPTTFDAVSAKSETQKHLSQTNKLNPAENHYEEIQRKEREVWVKNLPEVRTLIQAAFTPSIRSKMAVELPRLKYPKWTVCDYLFSILEQPDYYFALTISGRLYFLLQLQRLICCLPDSLYGPGKPYGPAQLAHEWFSDKHRNLVGLLEQKDAIPKGAYAELFVHDAKSSNSNTNSNTNPVVSHFATNNIGFTVTSNNNGVSLMPTVLIQLIASYDEVDCVRDETLILNNFLKQCKSSHLQFSLARQNEKPKSCQSTLSALSTLSTSSARTAVRRRCF